MALVLGQIAGAACPMEFKAEAPEAGAGDAEGDLRAMMTAAGSLRGEMAMRVPQGAVLGVAQIFLGEAQDASASLSNEHREAAEEFLRQVAGQVATALKPAWGEVQLRLEFGSAPSWPPGAGGWVGPGEGAPAQLWVEWQASAALLAALRQSRAESSAAAAAPVPVSPTPVAPPAAGPGNLDLFMDVELGVTLCFGGRSMLLREILELGSGSVVELDRQLNEPADLLLDGKLIARGEVVVVDGSYGLRIQEVESANVPAGLQAGPSL